jgi:hypothetical protein
MGVEQLAVVAKHPNKYLHGKDVEPQTSVREGRVHVSNEYRTPAEVRRHLQNGHFLSIDVALPERPMRCTLSKRVDPTERATSAKPGRSRQENHMVITAAHLSPMLSIVFGVLILIVPRFLNYLVAIYLILAGLLGLGILR